MFVIKFYKYHGAGNDFIIVENLSGGILLSMEQIAFLCDRHKGIGADGVILIESSKSSDCFMNYYNSDGTLAEMCGNGIRCTASFLRDCIPPNKKDFKIETRAGIKTISLGDDETFSVNMGKPVFIHDDFPRESVELEGLNLNFVSIGNPHAVAFVQNLEDYNLPLLGPKIEHNNKFPNKINLELVERKSSNEFSVRVWERGCGITLACGTGACAVYALCSKNKYPGRELTFELLGGRLFISENSKGEIIMRGPARKVYTGKIEVVV